MSREVAMKGCISVLVIIISSCFGVWSLPCVPRKFNHDSVVCVCNATYCDFLQPQTPTPFQYHLYTSDREGRRFHLTEGSFRLFDSDDFSLLNIFPNHTGAYNAETISIDLEESFPHLLGTFEDVEQVEGFGGAFTDSTAINYFSLSAGARNNLIRSYFSPEGIGYNLCRLTIAGNDFSPRLYTYDDVAGDTSLAHFSLTEEDHKYKIPMILDANFTSGGSLHVIACAWTAPPWMKDSQVFLGKSSLKLEYFQTFANYLVKFLDQYKDKGVDIWALSTGNEPLNGLFGDYPERFQFNCMGWGPFSLAKWVDSNLGPSLRSSRHPNNKIFVLDEQKIALPWFLDQYKDKGVDIWALSTGNEPLNGLFGDYPERFQFNCMGWGPFSLAKWVDSNLGPSLRSSRHPNTKIFVLDEQKIALPWYLLLAKMYGNQWMSRYVHGIAVHWYLDAMVNVPDVMRQTRESFPHLQIINTEASHGINIKRKCVTCLGLWERVENYAENIIENMNLGMAGWIEYNLALDTAGGPLWHTSGPLDAPIIVSAGTDEFYKQPMFYGIGHFSKFIRRGARVVKMRNPGMVKILVTVFEEREVAAVILNRSERFVVLKIRHPFKGFIYISLTPRSISTLVFQK